MSYKIPSKEYIDTRINSFNNGPKDVFDTVAELVSTNPDHGYIYLVLENGYWYFWDGEEWLQGGHYGTTPEIIQLKTDAQTAKNDAVIAKGQAEGARDIAVTAKEDAVIAKGLAEDARDTAIGIAGGVAGHYDTAYDLDVANPDHGSVYLVIEDANWYYWNTTTLAWTAGGVYSNEPAITELDGRVDDIEDRVTALDTITYDGITYVITRAVVDDHIVETYTEVE